MTPADDTRLTGRAATVLGASVVLLEFMAAVTTFVSSTLLPVVVSAFDAAHQVGILVSGSAVGLFLAMPLADQLLHAMGSARTLVAGAALTVCGGIVSATSANSWVFAGGRLVAGFAGGLLAVFGVSAAVRHLDDAKRHTVIAFSSAMWILPGLVAPPLIVLAEHLIGWRWTLLLPVPFVVAAQLVIFHSVPSALPSSLRRPVWRTLLVPLGIGGFLLASNAPRWCFLVVAAVGFRSLMPTGTLTARRGPPAALLALTLFGLGYFGAGELLTLLFTGVSHSSLTVAGAVLGCASAAWGMTSVALTRLPRLRRVSPAAAMVLVALCTAGTCVSAVVGAPWPMGAACWVLSGVGVGIFYPSVYLRATTPATGFSEERAAAAAISTESFGSLTGGAVGGVLVSGATDSDARFTLAYLLLAGALAVAAVAALRASAAPASDAGASVAS